MTVAELIEELKKLDPDLPVVIWAYEDWNEDIVLRTGDQVHVGQGTDFRYVPVVKITI
jgi:hypothetical protein